MPGIDDDGLNGPPIRGAFGEPRISFFLMDSGFTSRGLTGAGGGRRKAATEIMPLPWRGGGGGGGLPGESDTPCGCGRERCELAGVRLGGSSGGVRKDVLLTLDSDGEDSGACTILGGGSCACCTGVDAPDGEGGPFVGDGCSNELRGTDGDTDARPRARAKGDEEAGITESLLDRGDIAGGVLGVGGAKAGGGRSFVGGWYIRESSSRATSRAAAAFNARSSSGSSAAAGGVGAVFNAWVDADGVSTGSGNASGRP